MNSRLLPVLALGLMAVAPGANAVTVNWTNWTSITNGASSGAASGTMGGVTVTVSSTAIMDGVSQTGPGGPNYWTEPNASDRPYTGGAVSNAPTANEQVGLNRANNVTVTFSSPITSLYMALLSVGQSGVAVTYDFNQSFVIDSEGQGFWGNDLTDGVLGVGDTLTMREFHGLLRFNSPVSSLNFITGAENWHAFTFGSPVPEPGTLALLGLGLVGLGLSRRRKA